jgi:hypothetical protein
MKPTMILSKPVKMTVNGHHAVVLHTDAGYLTVKEAAKLLGVGHKHLGMKLCRRNWQDKDIFEVRQKGKHPESIFSKDRATSRAITTATFGDWARKTPNVKPPTRILEPPVKEKIKNRFIIFLKTDSGWLSAGECAELCGFQYSTKLTDRLNRGADYWKREDIFDPVWERSILFDQSKSIGSDDEKAATKEWLKLSNKCRFKRLEKIKIGKWEAAQL